MPAKKHKGPYIPRADGAFRDWLNNFAAVLASSPSTYKVSASETAKVAAIAAEYEQAYVRATSPETRCPTATAKKNAARRKAWDIVRPLSMRIRALAKIANAQVIRLGVYPRRRKQSPIRAPRRAPVLSIDGILPGAGVHRLRYQDAANPTRRAKPPGALSLQLLVIVSKKAKPRYDLPGMVERRGWSRKSARRSGRRGSVSGGSGGGRWHGGLKRGEREDVLIVTRHVFNVKFRKEDYGKTATYFGRWMTQRGLTSPWSMPVSLTIG